MVWSTCSTLCSSLFGNGPEDPKAPYFDPENYYENAPTDAGSAWNSENRTNSQLSQDSFTKEQWQAWYAEQGIIWTQEEWDAWYAEWENKE